MASKTPRRQSSLAFAFGRPIFPPGRWRRLIRALLLCAVIVLPDVAPAQTDLEPGLLMRFAGEGGSDVTLASNVWYYLPEGAAPTPFLEGGRPVTVTWEGFVSVELRSEFQFQAELNGHLQLLINDQPVLDVATNGLTELTEPIRLNKGTNALVATFMGAEPGQGDAFLRLSWQGEETTLGPIAADVLTHRPDEGERHWTRVRRGRELILNHRCAHCHTGPPADRAIPELAMDAPSFEGIGSRRNAHWMAAWIANPGEQRSTAEMPRLFHGTDAATEAGAVAAYLATLKAPGATAVPSNGDADAGGRLFETLHCAACHNSPGEEADDPEKVSLQHVAWKFPEGALQSFLRNPDAHFQWIRMPDFKLSETEAADLATWLRTKSDAVPDATLAGDAATIDRGRALIQSVGCLNCHAGVEMENQFTAEPLASLDASAWTGGCLAESPVAGSRVPHFALSAEDRAALRAFANTDRESLTRHVPREFAARNLVGLNCADCHGKFDGFPRLELLGGKLKPEWAGPFIRGEIDEKPRPWLEARMPAFATRAALLAEGLAMQHGYPPVTPTEAPIDREAAEIGRKLTGSDGGFSCIACHGVGDFEATAVFEAPGINLALSGDRLRRDFFHLWLTNPLRIEPMTKMPVYFDQGRSPLPEYDGDAARQIRAMWEYVRLGDQMIPPGPAQ